MTSGYNKGQKLQQYIISFRGSVFLNTSPFDPPRKIEDRDERKLRLSKLSLQTKGFQALLTYLNMGLKSLYEKLHTAWEKGLSHIPTSHCPSHVRLKHLGVISQYCSSIMIEGILIIGFLHRKLKNTVNLRYDVLKQPMITKGQNHWFLPWKDDTIRRWQYLYWGLVSNLLVRC